MSLPAKTTIVRVEKKPRNIAQDINGRIYLDISSVKTPKIVDVTISKPHWQIMIDQRTEMKWSDFFKTKDGMVEPTCVKFNKWKQAGIPVKIVRCDNGARSTP